MILVTGCNPLGQRLAEKLPLAKGACDRSNPEIPRGFLEYDALDARSIERLLGDEKPETVLLAEEIDSIEYCEQHRVDAMEYNTRSVRFFCEAAVRRGIRVVYRSSAYVFDGRKPGGLYTETDRTNPLDVYGETKLMGEVHADKAPEFLIVRVGELYGSYSGNFASHIYNSLRCGEKAELARDMYFSPVLLEDAAHAIGALTTRRMTGWYNIAGPERISHYEFGRRIAGAFGLDEGLLVPLSMAELGLTVPVPQDTSLDSAKLSALLPVQGIAEGLAAVKRDLQSRRN